jgi:ribosome-associated protein
MNLEKLLSEVKFKALRSSGKGGQHVNKVSTKIELQFDVLSSEILSEEHKERLKITLKNRLTSEGVLILHCDESRSQLQNKKMAIERFFSLIQKGLEKKKKRKRTNIPKAVKEKRRDNKKRQSEKKASRKKLDLE